MLAQTSILFNGAIAQVLSISLELFVVLGVVALFFGYSLYRGKSRVVSILLSLHLSGLIFLLFPYWSFISEEASAENTFAIKAVLFVAVVLAVNVILKRMVESVFSELRLHRLIEAFSLAVATTGVLLAYFVHVLGFAPLYRFSPPLDAVLTAVFLSEAAFFWWVAGSALFLYVTCRK